VSRAASQARVLTGLLAQLRPDWRRDAGLPSAIDDLLRRDRRLGSRDRRLYREHIYTALRYLPWIEPLLDSEPQEAVRRLAWLASDSPAFRDFREELAAGLPPCPRDADEKARVLGADAGALTPGWFLGECPGAGSPPLRETLLSRAPLWIRLLSADPAPVLAEFGRLGWEWGRSPLSARALVLAPDSPVRRTDAYRDGRIEIQDIGSQLVLERAQLAPGGHWLDACAGAGGKTLLLAALLGPAGRIAARDARTAPLEELLARSRRAGLDAQIRISPPDDPPGGYDGVLVDAPCSGSGTWRRSPHLRWITTKASVHAASSLQLRLLNENAPRVRAGGLLVYATCSLCRSENESVVASFLEGSPEFSAEVGGLRLMPSDHDGDGFFVATLRRG
jgi:16S rRNA (cytosine967-C5)-methyltransferase